MTTDRLAIGIRFSVCVLAVMLFAACAEAPPPPPPPPPPPQTYTVPINEQLEGNWSATFPEGKRQVTIQPDPQLGDHNYVARLVDGDYGTIHPGAVLFTATPNPSIPNLVNGDQKCSLPGRMGLLHAPMSIAIEDKDHFTETLRNPGTCPGFPMKFARSSSR